MTRSPYLVQLLSDWRGVVPQGGTWSEVKHDGWRAARFPGIDGKVRLWTRNGFVIEGAGHILHQLERMEREAGEPLFFDGEFVVDGSLAATKHWCETGWKLGSEAGVFHVFDVLPLSEWRKGGGSAPLYQRKAMLRALMGATAEPTWEWRAGSRGRDEGGLSVALVEDSWATDAADVVDEVRRVWAANGEGIVLKDPEAAYTRTRSQAWKKVKMENQHKWSKAA